MENSFNLEKLRTTFENNSILTDKNIYVSNGTVTFEGTYNDIKFKREVCIDMLQEKNMRMIHTYSDVDFDIDYIQGLNFDIKMQYSKTALKSLSVDNGLIDHGFSILLALNPKHESLIKAMILKINTISEKE